MSDFVVHKEILQNKFKLIAEALGWEYAHKNVYPDEADYSYEVISLIKEGQLLLELSCEHADPDALWITSHHSVSLSIIFGPVDEVHILDEEPKVIIESFQGDWVNFIEISSEGNVYEYHHFPKEKYRLGLKHESD